MSYEENILWDSELEKDKELNEQLKKDMKKKPNYYLYIKFDKYPGNFEREFIGYVFGINPNPSEEDVSAEYRKCFWRQVYRKFDSINRLFFTLKNSDGLQIDNLTCYDDYKKFINCLNKSVDEGYCNVERRKALKEAATKIDNTIYSSEEEKEEAVRKLIDDYSDILIGPKKKIKDEMKPLYKDYLQRTWQDVDDWYENTWYNICNHFENVEYNCDSIRIQLSKPLNKKYEKIILGRIKNYCTSNVGRIIHDYENIRDNGVVYNWDKDSYETKLLSIELVDKNLKVKKRYDIDKIDDKVSY